jgi:hypothetical protein
VFPGPRRPTHQSQTADEEEIAMTLDYDEFLAEVQRDARHLPEPVRPWRHDACGAAALPTSWPPR